jgi:isoleucyl-tRNA synthetase
VEPVLDAWFDSGSMPAAQLHYPFENNDVFPHRFPADFICEAIDQTRGWFYSLLAVNTLVFGHTPYRNVLCLALLVDRDGQKMSKSRGNAVDPWELIGSRGADAVRWNFFSFGSPWTPRRVSETSIDETTRFLVTLWNTFSFFVTYANLDGWTPATAPSPPGSHVLDRWIRSRLHGTIEVVTDSLDRFDALRAAQALDALVDDLSNWYVRRSRPRFWNAEGGIDSDAHATLHECLRTIALLLAPFCPFVADAMHTTLSGDDESVHLADWPVADPAARDEELEAEIARARGVVSLGLAARNEARIKVRQPLRRALVLLSGSPADDGWFSADVVAEIADALNVRSVEHIADVEGLLDYTVVPNFRSLGPKSGPRTPAVKAALAGADAHEIRRTLDARGTYDLALGDGSTITLSPDDVDVRATSHEELALARDGGDAVALDTMLDDELRNEGTARDLVRVVNDRRKALGFEIADRIVLRLGTTGRIFAAAHASRDRIAREVLAVEIDVLPTLDVEGADTVDVDGEPVALLLERR